MLQEHDDARDAEPAGLGGGLVTHPCPVLVGCWHPGAALTLQRGLLKRWKEKIFVWEFVNVINSRFCSGAYLIDAMITWSRST